MNFKPNMLFLNRSFDKKRLKALLLWFRLNLSENAALKAVEILQGLGFRSATQGAISLGLDDLKTPTNKSGRVFQAQVEVALAHHEHHRGNRTPVELFQHLVDTWHRTSQDLTTEVVQLFHSTERVNPVYMMAFSGARGNISQVRQLVGMRGLMADPRGQIVGFPILSNFREGLTITEYFVSCYGARKGVVDTAIRTADAGYLTRRLADVSHHVVVRTTNCGTHESILLRDIKEGQKTILSLANRLVGRVLAEHVFLPANPVPQNFVRGTETPVSLRDTETPAQRSVEPPLVAPHALPRRGMYWASPTLRILAKRERVPFAWGGKGQRSVDTSSTWSEERGKLLVRKGGSNVSPGKDVVINKANREIIYRNSEITSLLAEKLAAHYLEVPVRSPLSCSLPWGVCQLCYGWGLSEGRRVTLGEAVGIIAAQSIGEPGTQLTLRTFHTGGVFSGELLNEIRAPYNGNVVFPTPLQGLLLRTPHGQIAFLTKVSGKMKIYETAERGRVCLPPSLLTPVQSKALQEVQGVSTYAAGVSVSRSDTGVQLAGRRSKRGNLDTSIPLKDNGVVATQAHKKSNNAERTLPRILAERGGVQRSITNTWSEERGKLLGSEAVRVAATQALRSKETPTAADSLVRLKEDASKAEFLIQPSTVIFVKQKEHVVNNQLLAEFSSSTLQSVNDQIEITQQVLSETAGQIWFKEIEYGNRKGPGSGSLGTYFSSQKLGGIWVLAGKPMMDIYPSFARPLPNSGVINKSSTPYEVQEYRNPSCYANPYSNVKQEALEPTPFRVLAKRERVPYAQRSVGGVNGGKGNYLRSSSSLFHTPCTASSLPLSSFRVLVAKRQTLSRFANMHGGVHHSITTSMRERVFLTPEGLRSSYPYSCATSNPNVQHLAAAKLNSIKEILLVSKNVSLRVGRNLILFPKINEWILKRKNLFKYHTYGVQNRLKRSTNTRQLHTPKGVSKPFGVLGLLCPPPASLPPHAPLYGLAYPRTKFRGMQLGSSYSEGVQLRYPVRSSGVLDSIINFQNNYGVLKYDYVLGYSSAKHGKKELNSKKKSVNPVPQRGTETPVPLQRCASTETPVLAQRWRGTETSVSLRDTETPAPLPRILAKRGKSQRFATSTETQLIVKKNLSINKKKVNIPSTTELCQVGVIAKGEWGSGKETSVFQKLYSSKNKFTNGGSFHLAECRTRGSRDKLDVLPLLSEGDLVTFTTNSALKNSRENVISLPSIPVLFSLAPYLTDISSSVKQEALGPTPFRILAKRERVLYASKMLTAADSGESNGVSVLAQRWRVQRILVAKRQTLQRILAERGRSDARRRVLGILVAKRQTLSRFATTSMRERAWAAAGVSVLVAKRQTLSRFANMRGRAWAAAGVSVSRRDTGFQRNLSFVTEKRRLQSAWIEKKRDYLTYLNKSISIPFTQQFKGGKGEYLTETPSNFINRNGVAHLQLSMFHQRGQEPIAQLYSSGVRGRGMQSISGKITPMDSLRDSHLFPGQLVTYGDNIASNIVTTESGQVLYIDSQRTTVRKAQTVLIYSQAIIAVLSGDWIKKGTPLMSLSYQKLVTGDIVQGLPKIEQFFEAPVLRDGTFWSDSLQAKLNQFFQEEREKLPLAEAVRKSFSEIQRVLVEGVLRVYISQGVLIADKHLEVIVRQMTCKGRILYSGDTGFLRNELVSLDKIENVNQVTYGQKALYHPQVRGITDASLESESFLSAASFQETTRVLSRDAIIGKTDLMRGLKERVIVGELIQAGTGLANNSVYNLLAHSVT